MDLTAEEVRVLGSLIEKELTTPEQYPLTTNSLRLACNQKTNREPVVELGEVEVDQAMLRLRQAGLARTVNAQGMRASKHKHVLGEAYRLDTKTIAVLGVLMVRGPQTVGELRTRTDRASAFESLAEVERVLADLAARQPEALVVRLERRPGQKEERWAHLFCGPDLEVAGRFAEGAVPAGSPSASLGSGARNELQARVEVLEAQLQQLQSQFGVLCAQLGVDVELALVSVEAAEPTWPEANRGSS